MTSRTTLTKPEETLLFDNPALLPHNPAPGTQLPKGNACATCGTVREWWIWNPYLRPGRWALSRQVCPCDDPPPPTRIRVTAAERPETDAESIDRLFHSHHRHKTFLSWDPRRNPRLTPLWLAAEAWANALPERTPALWFVGPPAIGKSHLIHAIANTARAHGLTTLTLSMHRLFDLCCEPYDHEIDTERQERRARRAYVKSVHVLSLRDAFAAIALPSELRYLASVLESREDHGLTTHVTSCLTPAAIRQRAEKSAELVALTTHRLEAGCRPPLIAPPGCSPVHALARPAPPPTPAP